MYPSNNDNALKILARSVTVYSLSERRTATCTLFKTGAGGVVSSVSYLNPTLNNVTVFITPIPI